jgi:hypothetical protein
MPEMTAEELAGELGLEERPAQMLLTACASVGPDPALVPQVAQQWLAPEAGSFI